MKTNPKEALTKTYQAQLAETKRAAESIKLSADADEDYNEARAVLKRLLQQTDQALGSLMALAEDCEHPRAYEVLAGLLKTSGDLAAQLIDLQKKRHELDVMNNPTKAKVSPVGITSTTNNAIFVGSTTELQRIIKGTAEKFIDITAEELANDE